MRSCVDMNITSYVVLTARLLAAFVGAGAGEGGGVVGMEAGVGAGQGRGQQQQQQQQGQQQQHGPSDSGTSMGQREVGTRGVWAEGLSH